MCGALRASDAGSKVVLMGWVNRRRDLGNLIFIDLRDRTGITQVVISAEADPELHKKAETLRSEFVIAVIGRVKLRDAGTINKNIPTGEIEVAADELRILNDCKPLPFSPSDNDIANEEVRLKYRYLDLRRNEMQYNIELRHRVALAIREYLNAQGFFEIETPFMTRSTPEGARDYLVPSRVHPGEFYALPQSPQQFKQILMISGFDKYFQIARCFRDEDLRADRQPEFTQIDLEMSYARPEMVYAVVEGFLTAAWKTIGVDIATPFPRMTYDEAIRLYGIDKPDMRLPAMSDVKSAFAPENLATLNIDPDLPIVAIVTPKVGELSRKERDDLKLLFGDRKDAKVFEDIKRLEKSFPDAVSKIREIAKPNADDLLVLVAGALSSAVGTDNRQPTTDNSPPAGAPSFREAKGWDSKSVGPRLSKRERELLAAAGQFRLALGQKFAARHGAFDQRDFRFLWVTDFPMFEWDETERPLERRASSLHLAARRRHGHPRERSRRGALARLRRGAQRHRAGLGLHSYSPPRHPEHHLQGAGHVARRAAGALRLLPRGAAIRHASPRRHRPRPRPHRDDPRRSHQPARSHPLPQNRQSHRPDDGRANSGQRQAAEGVGDCGGGSKTGSVSGRYPSFTRKSPW